jgi:hypothetical protein
MTTLQDLIDYANEHGFEPCDCVIKAQNFDNGHLYNVSQDIDEVWEPMIVLGYFPEN